MAANQPHDQHDDSELAAEVIRAKVARLYEDEPDALTEVAEAEQTTQRSSHQQFMYELSTSGKDLATIQTEWHNYYQGLPASDKHQVWHEFYASQSSVTHQSPKVQDAHRVAEHKQEAATSKRKRQTPALRDVRSKKEVQAAIRNHVSAGGKLSTRQHIQSLLFGLSMGLVVMLIFLFGFFNEVVIAPFIQPSRTSAATPLIIDSNSVPPSSKPEVIIPKINVQIPVDYTQTTTDEKQIENALDSGIVHYPTTVKPGELGNTALFGHSSNNIFNQGKYKFAFVLLHTLVPGDTFYLTYNNKVFVYKVITKTVVEPTEVGVLGPVAGQAATATLITCDPPGTSLRRLVIVGQQISPDPSGNTNAAAAPTTQNSTVSAALPGNGPTLWGRVVGSPAGKGIIVVVVVGAGLVAIRRANRTLQHRTK
jgi:LPXTG-site transpeptidase (sortase) family protein